MAINSTLADAIAESKNSGQVPAALTQLAAVTSGAVIANGTTVVKITDASVAHALNSTFSDVEVETALNALGTKINLLIDALEAFKLSASV